MLDQELLPLARDLARNGASRAMIISKLKKRGLDPFSSGLVADQALRPITLRKRSSGLLMMLLGGLCIAAALVLRPFLLVNMPIAIGMFGAFMIMLGTALLLHRTRLKPRSESERTRIE